MQWFSPAQCLGYVAFVLGVWAFLQKNDRRLKFLNASQCLVYCLHFLLLGNAAASATSLISAGRSFLALRTRSPLVAVLIAAINLSVGFAVAGHGPGWLTVIASCIATFAVFMMQGIPLRLVLLGCTMAWLANNILSGSIGGTALEVVIAMINISTIVRMFAAERQSARRPAPPGSRRRNS
jgi:hypothetical protein